MNTEPMYICNDLHVDHKKIVFYKNKRIGNLFMNEHNKKYLFDHKTSIMLSQNCLNELAGMLNQLNKE